MCSVNQFWKRVEVASYVDEDNKGYHVVQLDNTPIKTALRHNLYAPNAALAQAMVQEWHSQEDQIDPHSMPITTICHTAIDNPMGVTNEDLIHAIIEIFENDMICALADEPQELVDKENELWLPIHKWFENEFGVRVHATTEMSATSQLEATKDVVRERLRAYNTWQLYGLHTAMETIKSLILTLAVVNGRCTLDEAYRLSRLELHIQCNVWASTDYRYTDEEEEERSKMFNGLLVHKLADGMPDLDNH